MLSYSSQWPINTFILQWWILCVHRSASQKNNASPIIYAAAGNVGGGAAETGKAFILPACNLFSKITFKRKQIKLVRCCGLMEKCTCRSREKTQAVWGTSLTPKERIWRGCRTQTHTNTHQACGRSPKGLNQISWLFKPCRGYVFLFQCVSVTSLTNLSMRTQSAL